VYCRIIRHSVMVGSYRLSGSFHFAHQVEIDHQLILSFGKTHLAHEAPFGK